MVEIYGYSFTVLPLIAAAVYAVIELLKAVWFDRNADKKKYLPLIAGVLGALLGAVLYFAVPAAVPASEWYSAVLIGLASGLSAVGINQIGKQLGSENNPAGGAGKE